MPDFIKIHQPKESQDDIEATKPGVETVTYSGNQGGAGAGAGAAPV